MLFRREFFGGLRSGAVTLAFRRWRRPTVRAGGTLLTPAGRLGIVSMAPVRRVPAAELWRTGYASLESLTKELRSEGVLYRIELRYLGGDPRVALRGSGEGLEEVAGRLLPLDRRTLKLIRRKPGVRAGDLCALAGQSPEAFKRRVRKLKNLGLSESLGTGYRISARGRALLAALKGRR